MIASGNPSSGRSDGPQHRATAECNDWGGVRTIDQCFYSLYGWCVQMHVSGLFTYGWGGGIERVLLLFCRFTYGIGKFRVRKSFPHGLGKA